MIRYKELHIPEPCYKVHYDSLPFDSIKRPCDICKKPVYDFRDKDENFFYKIWKKHNGNFCGAFRNEQFDEFTKSKQFKFSLIYLRKTIVSVLLGLWTFLSKAQEDNKSTKPTLEYSPVDTLINSKSQSFIVMTKDCRTCLDEFSIKVSINNIYHNSYRVNDSTIITLPSTVKPTDLITIEKKRRVGRTGWINKVTKTKKIEFKFEDKNIVEVKTTKKRRIRIIYKRDWVGCPKFRT